MEAAYGLMLSPDGMLWVPDFRNARMSILDPIEGFETSYPLEILSRAFVWQGVMMSDGRVVKPSITLGPPRRSLWRVYGSDMTQVDSILLSPRPTVEERDPPGSFRWEAPDGRSGGVMGVPFYPRGQGHLDPEGTIWSSTQGDPSYRITGATIDGDTTLIFETRRAPLSIPREVRDSAMDAVREYLVPRGGGNQDWSKVPDVRPAVEEVFAAGEDRIWVQRASNSWARYDVYDRSGRFVRSVDTSYRVLSWLRPIARGDSFWAVVVDDLDVQYVVRARIVRAAAVEDETEPPGLAY